MCETDHNVDLETVDVRETDHNVDLETVDVRD